MLTAKSDSVPPSGEPASAAPKSSGPASSPPQSEHGSAVRGGAFTLTGQIGTQCLRMVGQVVLTRLLPTEAFGLMAIVHSARSAIDMCSDVGIAPSIVRDPNGGQPTFLDTAWTIQVLRGVAIFAVVVASAFPLAALYGEPRLMQLVPVSALAALLAGLQSPKLALADRYLNLGRPMAIEVLAQVGALTLMIVWASIQPSVWALVAGGLAGVTIEVLLGHLILRGYTASFGWDRAAASTMLRFGRWVFLSTLLTFAVTQSDRLVFGKMISLSVLGVYHVAATLASIPITAIQSLASKVLFPLFSRADRDSEAFIRTFRDARGVLLALSGWVMSGLIGGSPAAIALVYDDRYEAGGWMLRWLALAGWVSTAEAANSAVLLAQGQPRWLAAGNLAKLVGMVSLVPAYALGGFKGALIAYSATELLRYAVSTWAMRATGLAQVGQDVRMSALVLVSSVVSGFLLQWMREQGAAVPVQCLAVFVAATAVWAPVLLPLARRLRRGEG